MVVQRLVIVILAPIVLFCRLQDSRTPVAQGIAPSAPPCEAVSALAQGSASWKEDPVESQEVPAAVAGAPFLASTRYPSLSLSAVDNGVAIWEMRCDQRAWCRALQEVRSPLLRGVEERAPPSWFSRQQPQSRSQREEREEGEQNPSVEGGPRGSAFLGGVLIQSTLGADNTSGTPPRSEGCRQRMANKACHLSLHFQYHRLQCSLQPIRCLQRKPS